MSSICGSRLNGQWLKKREVCDFSESGGKNTKSVWWNDEVMLQLGKRRLLGRRCCQLALKSQKKGVWKLIKKRGERLKGVYIRAKRKSMNSLEGR